MPLRSLTNRFQPVNERIVRLDGNCNRNVVGLFEANGLQKLASNVLHGLCRFEVNMIGIWCVDGMEDFGNSELGGNDVCCVFLAFCHLGGEIESSADAFS